MSVNEIYTYVPFAILYVYKKKATLRIRWLRKSCHVIHLEFIPYVAAIGRAKGVWVSKGKNRYRTRVHALARAKW